MRQMMVFIHGVANLVTGISRVNSYRICQSMDTPQQQTLKKITDNSKSSDSPSVHYNT